MTENLRFFEEKYISEKVEISNSEKYNKKTGLPKNTTNHIKNLHTTFGPDLVGVECSGETEYTYNKNVDNVLPHKFRLSANNIPIQSSHLTEKAYGITASAKIRGVAFKDMLDENGELKLKPLKEAMNLICGRLFKEGDTGKQDYTPPSLDIVNESSYMYDKEPWDCYMPKGSWVSVGKKRPITNTLGETEPSENYLTIYVAPLPAVGELKKSIDFGHKTLSSEKSAPQQTALVKGLCELSKRNANRLLYKFAESLGLKINFLHDNNVKIVKQTHETPRCAIPEYINVADPIDAKPITIVTDGSIKSQIPGWTDFYHNLMPLNTRYCIGGVLYHVSPRKGILVIPSKGTDVGNIPYRTQMCEKPSKSMGSNIITQGKQVPYHATLAPKKDMSIIMNSISSHISKSMYKNMFHIKPDLLFCL